ncbi:hypothetical protein E0H22_24880 [Rhodopseudomonas boonkerdii]|jgi:hypothetical protein|uniref:hypothetical protein n=1 Tax=Hyphomicrobiales TaxID=356 RepID=UPI00124F75E5|nr:MULTISPECIES: hypothetical protein [Hyphomicrobiales]KAB2760779.1 hypothetical protein F9K81_04905 [Brucella anthropi]UGV28602.1 hypothetical protein E0H22_24880 [Rhodopseudomonas boonkerdii]
MSKLYYAEPELRESQELRDLFRLPVGFTPDTPGARLAMAVDHYTTEAYTRRSDRDAACGVTAHPDITYAAVAASSVKKTDEIGCGYAIHHPDFEKVLDPIFSRAVKRLIANMAAADQKAEDPIATEVLSIARTCYKIETIGERDIIRFRLAWNAFEEKPDRTTIEQTCAFLEDRLHLAFLPTPPRRKAH